MLFRSVLSEMGRDHRIDDLSPDDLARYLRKHLFADRDPDDMPGPLLILIHSFTLPTAAGAVGRKLQELFTRSIQAKLGDRDGLRAAAMMSMLIGLRMMHGFLNLASANDMSRQEAAQGSGHHRRTRRTSQPSRPQPPICPRRSARSQCR